MFDNYREIIEIIILGLVLAYREVGILCERRSWDYKWFLKLYWNTDQSNFWVKIFDWFHISNGLVVLIISHIIAKEYQLIGLNFLGDFKLIGLTILYWVSFFYIRDLGMHVLLPRYTKNNPQLRLWYLIPLIGGYLQNKFGNK